MITSVLSWITVAKVFDWSRQGACTRLQRSAGGAIVLAISCVAAAAALELSPAPGVVHELRKRAERDDASLPDPLAGLDAYVVGAMRSWDAPGLSLVLVRGDGVVTRGYGVTEVGGDAPVDEHTLFVIGSLTKAFTATLLAILVDEGKIAWDDPVIRHLPDFAMADPRVTRELTLRDVLSHRTGLAGNDLMWAAGGASPRELIRRLRFQEPAHGFRAGFGYHNVMYLLAGELAAEVTGKPWDQLVRERILEPLGMERSTTSMHELRRRSDVALPHDEIGPGQTLGNAPSANVPLDAPNALQRVEWFDPVTAPAGGMASSAAEFGRWLRFQLGTGEIDGRRLVGREALLATRTPQIPRPGFPASQEEASETNLATYGMGWGLRDYRGRLMVSHLGSTPGWGSAMALLPAEGAGVAVFVNTTQGLWLANAVMRWILDRLLGAELEEWYQRALDWAEERRRANAAVLERAAAERTPGTTPSLQLAAYAGTYVDSLYPPARVTFRKGKLRLVLGPELSGDLEHWQEDTFRATWDRAELGANFVTFDFGDGAHPETIEARILGQEAVWRRSDEHAEGPAAATAFPVAPELFVDDPFEGCEGLSFNGEDRLFVACNRAVWEVLSDRTVRRVTDTHSNLGLAPTGERDLVMADFGPTNVFTDGDAAALDGVVWRITPEGEKTSIATGIRDPNAVLVRPDGSLLVSDDGTDEIYLVTPSGEVSVFSRAVAHPNGLALSLDGRTLYVAQIFRQMGPIVPDNRVWALPLDAAGYPAGDARLLAELGEEGLNDGVAVDALDRVYVAENAGGRVWRIDPVSGRRVVVAEGMPHVASLAFGRGAFGNAMLYATTTARGGGKIWRMEVGVEGAPLHR